MISRDEIYRWFFRAAMRVISKPTYGYQSEMLPWLEKRHPRMYAELIERLPSDLERLWRDDAPFEQFDAVLDRWLEIHGSMCSLYRANQLAEGKLDGGLKTPQKNQGIGDDHVKSRITRSPRKSQTDTDDEGRAQVLSFVTDHLARIGSVTLVPIEQRAMHGDFTYECADGGGPRTLRLQTEESETSDKFFFDAGLASRTSPQGSVCRLTDADLLAFHFSDKNSWWLMKHAMALRWLFKDRTFRFNHIRDYRLRRRGRQLGHAIPFGFIARLRGVELRHFRQDGNDWKEDVLYKAAFTDAELAGIRTLLAPLGNDLDETGLGLRMFP